MERDVHLVLDPIRLGLSIPQATWMLARRRPAAVFTTGGYVAIPVLIAAAILRIPTLLWEGNVVPGRSVRATARLATRVAVTFDATCAALGLDERCLTTGTPIRELRGIDGLAARARLGIPAGERMVLIFGGSQAVRRFNEAVAEALPALVDRCHLLHVTGDDGYAAALAAREHLSDRGRARYHPIPFLRDEMGDALAAADLVVGRAGSSTVSEVTAAGLPFVAVPYPHAGNHQRANAEVLRAAGAAQVIEDEAFDGQALLRAVAIVEDPSAHVAMTAASRALGRPAAADAVATILLALAERRTPPTQQDVTAIARGGA